MTLTYDIANWMSLVDNSTMLSELSIPGTHDSAAMKRPGFDDTRLTTQTRTLKEQLEAGVRFLDLRCGYVNKEFGLYHESKSLHLTFTDARDTCKQFLDAHPTEIIIASIKNEYEGSGNDPKVSFGERFLEYVEETPGLWFLENAIPRLRQVRKKIVLFRRFELNIAMELGINAFNGFPNNETKTIPGPPTLTIQDKYSLVSPYDAAVLLAEKWVVVAKLLEEASQSGDRNVLYVNFTSAAGRFRPKFPDDAAEFINPKLASYFVGQKKEGRFGIIPRDYEALFGDVNTPIAHANVPYDMRRFVHLKNKRDGDVIDVISSDDLIAYPQNSPATLNQIWLFNVSGTAPYFVIGSPYGGAITASVITVIDANVQLVGTERKSDDDRQTWTFLPSDETAQYFFIANSKTPNTHVITVDSPRREKGTPLFLRPRKTSDNDDQLWSVVPIN